MNVRALLSLFLLSFILILQSCSDRKARVARLYNLYNDSCITIIDNIDGSGRKDSEEVEKKSVFINRIPSKLGQSLDNDSEPVDYLPFSTSVMPEIIFKRKCYTVSYNKETKLPNWVAWHLRGECVIKREDDVWHEFLEDSCLAEGERATLEDYAASGYDRGHMCPVGDCNWNIDGRDETFLLSNICPQNSNLNRGDWKEIEHACRRWAKRFGDIYIVCGPVFLTSQQHERIGPNMIPVPEAFFKVVLCLNDSPKGIGFICRNTDGNRKKDFYVNSIRQVERITGYRFFPNLSDSIKDVVFDMSDISVWQE